MQQVTNSLLGFYLIPPYSGKNKPGIANRNIGSLFTTSLHPSHLTIGQGLSQLVLYHVLPLGHRTFLEV